VGNRNTQSLEGVEEDVAEIAEDVEEVQKDVDEIQKDVDEIEKDIDEVQKDVDEIQEDVEDITEGETADEHRERVNRESLDKIEATLGKLIDEIEKIKAQR
jgi:chromosome segregation ATPase